MKDRRWFIASLLGIGAAIPSTTKAQTAGGTIAGGAMTNIEIVPNLPSAAYLPFAEGYRVGGSAYSANGKSIHWQVGLPRVKWARWLLMWHPRGDLFTGVRLVTTSIPNIPPLEITGDTWEGPRCSGLVITDWLNAARELGQWQFIIQEYRGAPAIYGSVLEVVWEG